MKRLSALDLRRVTLDFDGSVLGTGRFAEATAVGFNPKKKGQRSYYPLFCTIAQTGQVLDVLHCSGNVYDSHGAKDFILYLLKDRPVRRPARRADRHAFHEQHLHHIRQIQVLANHGDHRGPPPMSRKFGLRLAAQAHIASGVQYLHNGPRLSHETRPPTKGKIARPGLLRP